MRQSRFFIFCFIALSLMSCENLKEKILNKLDGTWGVSGRPMLNDNLDNTWDGNYREYQYAYYSGGLDLNDFDRDETLDAHQQIRRTRYSARYIRRSIETLRDKNDRDFEVHFSYLTDDPALEKNYKLKDVTTDPDKMVPVKGLEAHNLNSHWKLKQGVNFLNAQILANISSIIYLNFETAAQAFHEMGFSEQYFFWAQTNGSQRPINSLFNTFDGQGVVLKTPGPEGVIVVAYRGTEPEIKADGLADVGAYEVNIGYNNIKIHAGFYKSMKDMFHFVREHIPSSLENRMRSELRKLNSEELKKLGIYNPIAEPDERPIFLTGHSLGAALSTVTVGELLFEPQLMVQLAREDLGVYKKAVSESIAKQKAEGKNISTLGLPAIELPSGLNDHHYFVDSNLRSLDYWKIKKVFEKLKDKLTPTHQELLKKIGDELTLEIEGEKINLPALVRLPIVENNKDVHDPRLHSLITFGSPRAGNESFKSELENYARENETTLLRIENVWRPQAIENTFFGDIVTRAPVEKVGHIQYSHVGYRMFYNSGDDEFIKGNKSALECEYTHTRNEAILNMRNLLGIIDSGMYHLMDRYIKRISSYLTTDESWYSGDIRLDPEHTCSDLTRGTAKFYQ